MRPNKRGTGELTELYLENGLTGGRLLCPQNLIPEPGQYLLAHDSSPARRGPGRADSPLPAPIFNAGSFPGGFLLAPPIPQTWQPGISLSLRGPLGRGFSLPPSARRVALVSLGETAARLKPLLTSALEQNAALVLVSDLDVSDLPLEVEVQPVSALAEVARWADYLAIDMDRESLPGLREMLGLSRQARATFARPGLAGWAGEAQALVLTPMPCGGLAECGVCAVTTRRGWKMACKDGPVFDLKELT
jgi:dihydroorotate dehydrogenase electron transfer subunit